MSYIGRQPTVGNFQICDAISVVNGQAAYTMQVGSVNVLPETANHMIVSLNGTIQKPNSSFTVSGSTITFSSNLATGDVIDFIQILGDVLDLGVPSDATVTTAKLADGAVTSAKITYPLTTFSSTGIDDNSNSLAMTIDSSENIGIGTTSPASIGSNITTLEITGGSTVRTGGLYLSNSDKSIKGTWYGSNTGYIFGTESNSDLKIITNNTERMRIDSSGKVGIATANANFNLTVSNNSTETSLELVNQSTTGNHRIVDFVDGAGSLCGNITINTGSNVVAYNTSSDYRLKENVDYTFDATTRLKQLKPARFNFIKDTDTTVDGFLAHEVSSIVPEAIFGTHNEVEVWRDGEELPDGVSIGDNKLDDNGNTIPKYQGIDQSKLVPLLVKTIQELEARITELENA